MVEKQEPIGINMWGKPRGSSTLSKMELITMIAQETGSRYLDISALTISDLKIILRYAQSQVKLQHQMPKGRLKQPYIKILTETLPSVKNLGKLSVDSLQHLTGAFI